MRFMTLSAAAVASLLSLSAVRAEDNSIFNSVAKDVLPEDTLWQTNFAKAQAQAAKEKKDLLVNFTGSDWCGWCIKLTKEVFQQKEFIEAGPKKFVLVELDFPKNKPLPKEITEQNDKLMKRFGIQGFPTILLMDSEGRPYVSTGYQKGGPTKYLEHLTEMQKGREKRDQLLAKAAAASGLERAKLLDQALAPLHEAGLLAPYAETIEEIIKLDPKNEAGLQAKYKFAQIQTEIADGKFEIATKKIDALVKEFPIPAEMKQHMFYLKATACERLGDHPGAIAALQTAVDADPNSENGKQLAQIIERLKAAEKTKEKSGVK